VHFLSSVKKDVQCNATRMPELIDVCREASMDAKVVCWESCRKTMLIPDPHGPSASNGGDGSCNRSEIAARPRLGQGLGSLDMTTVPFGFPQTSSTSIARYLDTMFAGQGAAIRAFIVNGVFCHRSHFIQRCRLSLVQGHAQAFASCIRRQGIFSQSTPARRPASGEIIFRSTDIG
jgi:hypothetical protein